MIQLTNLWYLHDDKSLWPQPYNLQESMNISGDKCALGQWGKKRTQMAGTKAEEKYAKQVKYMYTI